jgi:hypothetical protein
MNELEKLTPQEKELLYKAPAYVSLLAANADGKMDEEEKKSALETSHIKTFSCLPALKEFYDEVGKSFENNIQQLNNTLPSERVQRNEAITKSLAELESIFAKLGNEYAEKLHTSFVAFSEHVSKAHHSLIASFLFPFYIKGFNDR